MGSRERRGRKNNNNKNDDPITRTKLGDLYPRDSLLPQHQVSEVTIVGVDKPETLPNRPPCSEMDFPAIIGHHALLSPTTKAFINTDPGQIMAAHSPLKKSNRQTYS